MSFRFAMSETPVLPLERASVFYDGIFSAPKLSHPEGVAVGPDGWVWTGTQDGNILRISPNGTTMEHVTSTEGFALGLAFDGDKALFICDLKHAAVLRFDLTTCVLKRFTAPGIKIPNYPLVDAKRGCCLCQTATHLVRRDPGSGLMIWRLEKAHFGSRTI